MSIVNVALPTMARDLGDPPGSLAAVSTTYLLTMAVCIPSSGWLGDRFGARNVILGATCMFTASSILCGIAGSLPTLLFARSLQGGSAGMMTPVGIALLYRLVSPQRRIRLSAVISIPTSLGPALGPVLGGLLTTDLSWRWAFFINVPVGLAVVVFGSLCMESHRMPGDRRLDFVGLALAASGLGLTLFGVSEAPERGWTAPSIDLALVAGLLLLTALCLAELRIRYPLIDLRILKDACFRRSALILAVGSFGFWSWLYLLSQFNQNVLGLDPLLAGLVTLPLAGGYLCGSQLTSRVLYPRIGARRTMSLGLTALAACMAGMALLGRTKSYEWLEVLLFNSGCFVPMVFMSSQTSAFMTISMDSMGRASTMYSALRQISGALGIAFAATLVVAFSGLQSPTSVISAAGPYRWVFVLTAVVVLGAAVWNGCSSGQVVPRPAGAAARRDNTGTGTSRG